MDDKELFRLRQNWYAPNSPAMFEMVKTMFGREVAILNGKSTMPLFEKHATSVRMIKAHAVSYLQKNFEAFDFYNKPYNIYNSVGYFENMPMGSFSPSIRKQQQNKFFDNITFDLCLKGYDLFLDLDAEKIDRKEKISEVPANEIAENIKDYYLIDEMYADAKRLKGILDEFGLQYSVKFSGLKGFHFIIKDKNIFPQNLTSKEKVLLADKLASNLKALEDIPCLDDSIYDKTRILKTAYSLEGYLVALPLSDEQFDSWDISKMRIDKVLQNNIIRNRGLLERPKKKDPVEFLKVYG